MSAFFPIITDGIVRVLPFEINHLNQRYVNWLNDKDVVKYSEQRHKIHTIESCKKYFHLQQECGNYFLAIEDENKIHIGNIGVTIDHYNKSADISIIIGDKQYWGKGFAVRSWNLVMNQLLEQFRFRVVTAGTMSCNKSMIALMHNAKMNIDAVLKNRFLLEGKETDLVVASKFAN